MATSSIAPGMLFALLGGILLSATAQQNQPASLGNFEGHSEIGAPQRAGSVVWDAAQQAYRVTGGGHNMWFTNDAFHFMWKVSGDIQLAADVTFLGQGGDPHRKACLLIRQDLAPDAAYADAVLHGDGLTSLQYREAKGAFTREIQSNISKPMRLRVEKRGNYVSMSLSRQGQPLEPAGGSFRLDLKDPYYVGLAVCAHNDSALETALFANVTLSSPVRDSLAFPRISTLETVTISSKDRRVVWWTTNLIEAPNWSPDGTNLYFNGQGRIFRIPVSGGTPLAVDTGFATRCNNDHGISPDGLQLVISDQSQGDRRSRIYILPLAGGIPRRITEAAPSYWHGWSPDGLTLTYCAERNGEFDVYAIPAAGGVEKRLTDAKGLDDGPEYSPDGRFIYFNSDRKGRTQIWRMKSDGSDQVAVVADSLNNWFPHPSPDGRWLAFLSYEPDVQGHPENKDVTLRLLSIQDGRIDVLAKLSGGQGTINVPSWSPDSRRLAFVSYQVR